MYRSVLENKDFIRWTHEDVVLLVTHDEREHAETTEPGPYDKPVKRCSLYAGLSCAEHVDTAVEVDTARGDDLVKVPFVELCPNTWLVLPTGAVKPVGEEIQFVVGKIREQVAAAQKELGAAVPTKQYATLQESADAADAAIDAGRWAEALPHLAALGKALAKPHAALKQFLEARIASVDTHVTWEFEEARDDAKLAAATKRERIAALLAAVDVEVLGARPPCHAALKAWLDAK